MNIKDFCDENDYRDYLRAPFNHNGYTWATNGWRLIRMPEDPQYGPLISMQPNFIKTLAKVDDILRRVWFQSANFNDIEIQHITCPECEGSKKRTNMKCPECDGDGEVEAETDYSTYDGLECKTCRGKGFVPLNEESDEDCGRCEGTGQIIDQSQIVTILDVTLNPALLKPLTTAINVEVAADEDKNMLLFRQGEYTGLIMKRIQ